MKHFEELYSNHLAGSISGWDRIAWRGTIRWLSSCKGLGSYLSTKRILLKDFKPWAMDLTDRVRKSCEALADIWGIRKEYIHSSSVNKEARARKIAEEDGVETGPICMFSIVEPCWSPWVQGNATTKKIDLSIRLRKCVWIYYYWNDEQTGFGHLRLQSWLPFGIKGCFNGRHWLERQLAKAGIDYLKDDNCFRWIQDTAQAQELMNHQLRTNWRQLLEDRRRKYFGVLDGLFGDAPLDYYWSADQTEWATDVMFKRSSTLDELFPLLARYGLCSAQSPSVMRFLGRTSSRGRQPGEVVSDLRQRYEGVRLKHWVNDNSIKLYNKAGNVLRVETTINQTRDFKVYRHPDDNGKRPASWQKMRKGVSDLHRRAEVSQSSNERYLDHLAAAGVTDSLQNVVSSICTRTRKNGTSCRAINPWNPDDFQTLQFLARGENQLNGFRNKQLREKLYGQVRDASKLKRLSARISHRLRLLRAHALIRKVPRTNSYQLTTKGRKVAAAVLAASSATTEQLMHIAA